MDTNEKPMSVIITPELEKEVMDMFGNDDDSAPIQDDIELEQSEVELEDEFEDDEEGSLEESSEEESDEAPKKATPKELKSKIEVLEKEKSEFEAKSKLLQKRLKKLSGIDEKYNQLIGEGYDQARKIVEARKANNLGGILKELGLSSDDLIDYFNTFDNYIKDPEAVKAEIKKQEELKRSQIIADQEHKVMRQTLALDASKFIAKFENKLPILSTLGDKGVDQVINTALQLRKEKSPLLIGCKNFQEVLRVVLPKLEKQLMKEYEPIVKKLTPKQEAQQEKSEKVKADNKKEEKVPSAKSQKVKPRAEASTEQRQKESSKSVEPSSRRLNELRDQEKRMKDAERELKRLFQNS